MSLKFSIDIGMTRFIKKKMIGAMIIELINVKSKVEIKMKAESMHILNIL